MISIEGQEHYLLINCDTLDQTRQVAAKTSNTNVVDGPILAGVRIDEYNEI